jgi:1,4-alpha-glucan branching enzyme
VAVLLDWVPGHFPERRRTALSAFRRHRPLRARRSRCKAVTIDWGTLIYNYGRTEVTRLPGRLERAPSGSRRYHIDGLRVDAVASMLYRDYSRPPGGGSRMRIWRPGEPRGRGDFLRRTSTPSCSPSGVPQATTAAEESTAWPQVSRPVEYGGLGFGYKWNMGWMHDTLKYIGKDPIHRKHHHGDILFGLHYAFSENFILPLSTTRWCTASARCSPRCLEIDGLASPIFGCSTP